VTSSIFIIGVCALRFLLNVIRPLRKFFPCLFQYSLCLCGNNFILFIGLWIATEAQKRHRKEELYYLFLMNINFRRGLLNQSIKNSLRFLRLRLFHLKEKPLSYLKNNISLYLGNVHSSSSTKLSNLST
jgi:hypothetical protein